MNKMTIRNIVLIWLAWALIVIGFQALSTARFQPQWPDMLIWYPGDPTDVINYRQLGHPYMLDPFMNNQVSWDSENYIGISIGGYEDPCITVTYLSIQTRGGTAVRCTDTTNRGSEKPIILSYAFFPFYPILIHLFAIPLSLLNLNAIATATLAGVIISALGTLAAMLALYDLTYEKLDEDGAMRAVFYMLIFPASFIFVQVYSEGLFVGLAFGCLAMAHRKHRVWAALLAVFATWTRAVGVALVIPLAIPWFRDEEWMELDMEWKQIFYQGIPLKALGKMAISLAPLFAFILWRFSWIGAGFDFIENNFFGRGFLSFGVAFVAWLDGVRAVLGHNPQSAAYYLTEFGAIGLGLAACWVTRRRYPEVAWFSFAVILLSLTSGPAQGMSRYVLGAPVVFVALAEWGKHPAFDRAWSIASVLLMGLIATMFTFDLWAG